MDESRELPMTEAAYSIAAVEAGRAGSTMGISTSIVHSREIGKQRRLRKAQATFTRCRYPSGWRRCLPQAVLFILWRSIYGLYRRQAGLSESYVPMLAEKFAEWEARKRCWWLVAARESGPQLEILRKRGRSEASSEGSREYGREHGSGRVERAWNLATGSRGSDLACEGGGIQQQWLWIMAFPFVNPRHEGMVSEGQ